MNPGSLGPIEKYLQLERQEYSIFIDLLFMIANTPCSGRHGWGPSRASIFSRGAGNSAGAMKVIEIL